MRRFHTAFVAAMVLVTFAAPAYAQHDWDGPTNYDSSFTTKQSIAPGGTIRIENLNGSVRATIEHLVKSSEPLELETVNGSVQLEAPADLNADVDAETTNGGIQSDFPLTISSGMIGKHIHGTVGQGGRRVELHTTNGSVKLRKLG